MSDREAAYNSAIVFQKRLGDYFMIVAKELGEEKAWEFMQKSMIKDAQESAEGLKNMLGDTELTAEMVMNMFVPGNLACGIVSAGEVVDGNVVFTNEQCSMYDGLVNAGFSHEMVKKYCETHMEYVGKTFYNLVGLKADPVIEKYRNDKDGTCKETLRITN